jgi:ATP-dependent HslUV protease ATP-binding subunit HslU
MNTEEQQIQSSVKNLTPREIVSELDRYVIGQKEAKRAVSIALRNRWRRLRVTDDMREEITPKNIIMIGSTGVGKTEIARRLAKLADAPFIKVEASKFTEVGYVGKDVESMIRDLVEISISMVKDNERSRVRVKAEELAEERLLDLLLPRKSKKTAPPPGLDFELDAQPQAPADTKEDDASREKMRQMLRDGRLDERKIELDIGPKSGAGLGGAIPMVEIVSSGGSMDDISNNIRDMLSQFMPQKRKNRRVKIKEALALLVEDEAQRLIDMEHVTKKAIDLAQTSGIIFIDEIDKIASARGEGGRGGPDVSREGVQRDILPIIEGSTVSTKYGFVRTDHILFIAAGAFHMSKPSDLIPELQGRFPIRVELSALTKEDFYRILTEPRHSLTKQYASLMGTEGIELEFTENALTEMAALAAEVNQQMENIGARRLHTILEKVMDEISFTASERTDKKFTVDAAYVKKCLATVVKDQDLRKFIL